MVREPATVTATASIAGEAWAEASVLAVSVWVEFGPGAGMGTDLFFAH